MGQNTKIIAVVGKGGVGKTALAAALVRSLVENRPGSRILAIDADPAVGLATALQVQVKETLDDIRQEITKEVGTDLKDVQDILSEARFRLLDMMEEKRDFAFVAIGRPESSGCYCAINSYLRDTITVLAEQFDYVVIDGEAGIEQVNRRVMEKVSHLLLVSDQSRKGIQVIRTIQGVAKDLVQYERLGVVINRVPVGGIRIPEPVEHAETIYITEDHSQMMNDIEGKSVFELPEDSALITGAEEILRKLDV
ncbi:MAG: AAA family ATPase [Eubacteriales bacterium]|nr:AAA family ATPase [Eubacteriales bacterium]